MNIEATLISYLNGKGFDAYADIPADRPDEFVTVERTGGTDEVGISRPTIAIQAWSTSRYNASEHMYRVDDAMKEAIELPEVTKVNLNGIYNFPDESGAARYQAVYDLVTYKE